MDHAPIPPPFNIPDETIERWLAIDATKPLLIPLTRAEVDHLFFSIDQLARATASLQYAVVEYTNGRLETANAANADCRTFLSESNTRLRQFMASMMMMASVDE